MDVVPFAGIPLKSSEINLPAIQANKISQPLKKEREEELLPFPGGRPVPLFILPFHLSIPLLLRIQPLRRTGKLEPLEIRH